MGFTNQAPDSIWRANSRKLGYSSGIVERKKLEKIYSNILLEASELDGERPPVGVKVSLAGSGVSYQSHILLTGWNNVLKRFIRFIDINFRALSIKSGMPPKRK